MNIKHKLSILLLGSLLAACTSENTLDKPTPPDQGGTPDDNTREVLLSLKNKLKVIPVETKAGDAIATAEENRIYSLDVYVFGSKTEDGEYTFLQQFYYREDARQTVEGDYATSFTLNTGADNSTALLRMKKGLFVKVYCIANSTKLLQADGNEFAGFQALLQSNPGQPGNTITAGIPTESDFKAFHTPVLQAGVEEDVLLTPLPMTGAYTTPLDLTDFSVSARTQLGFKLTRMVARFDVVNNAALSKFTIESVSMGNGRTGAGYFPVKVLGNAPTDLITYPARAYTADQTAASPKGTGIFYCYPSPVDDGGYLILSGTYAANQTENIPVTYKVPFKPAGNETGNYIEVAYNHRYTVSITAADEYHLDFTIDVADWTDEGSIDDYEPGGETDKDGMKINIIDDNGTYDADTRTVTMAITNDARFTIEGGSSFGYFTTLYYENGDVDHQWLTMDPEADNMPTKAEAIQKYTIKKNDSYSDTKYPVAFIRFTGKISAKETVVIVQPIANPVVKEKTISNGSTINVDAEEIVLYQSSSVASPTVTFSVFASGGSKLEFPDDDTPGNWLTVSPATEQSLSQSDYTLTLNTAAADFPDPFPVGGKTINIVNKGDETKKTTFKLKLKSDITTTSAIAGNAEFDASKDILRLYNNPGDKITLNVNAIGGVELDATSSWLTVDKTITDKNKNTYVFSVGASGSTDVNQKLTFRSKADNSITKIYTVYSIKKELVFSNYTDNSSYSYIDNLNNVAPAITYFPCENSYCEFTVVSPKGINISASSAWASVTEYSSDKNSATGVVTSKVRVQRTQSGDYYGDLRQSTFTAAVSNKYPSQASKSFSIAQKEVVYPNSNSPAKSISSADNRIQWWVAPINENNGNKMYYTTFESNKNRVCPSGWKVPSSANYRTLIGATGGNAISNDHINQSVLNSLYDIYGRTDGYYSSDNQNGPFRCGMIPLYYFPSGSYYCVYVDGLGDSSFYIRCVKDR